MMTHYYRAANQLQPLELSRLKHVARKSSDIISQNKSRTTKQHAMLQKQGSSGHKYFCQYEQKEYRIRCQNLIYFFFICHFDQKINSLSGLAAASANRHSKHCTTSFLEL